MKIILRSGRSRRSVCMRVGPSISGMITSLTTRSTSPLWLAKTSSASAPVVASSAIAARAARARGEAPDRILVLDEQHRAVPGQVLRLLYPPLDLGLLDLVRTFDITRQVDAHDRALTLLAVGEDEATGLLDDAVDGGKSKSRAAADLLGREERLEDLLHHVGAHAGAGIAHFDQDIFAGGDMLLAELARGRLIDIGGADKELAAIRHGVARIDGEVPDNLLELMQVGLDGPEIAPGLELELDILAE